MNGLRIEFLKINGVYNKMLKCVDYNDTIFKEPIIFIENGLYGEGYIISARDKNIIVNINLNYPELKTWFEDGCVKIFSMNGKQLYEIPKYMHWNVIQGWAGIGANIDFWLK